MKQWLKRIGSTSLLLVVVLSMIFMVSKAAEFEITETYVGYYNQYHNNVLEKRYQAKMHKLNGKRAYCVSMTKSSRPGSAKEVNIKKYLPGDELVMACLAQKHIFAMDGYTTAEKYMLTQCMVWYIQRDHIADGGWRQYVDGIDKSVSQQKTFFADLEKQVKKEAPDYEGHGTAYENVDIADVQEVAILDEPTLKTGDAKLVKISDNPSVSEDNNCYSLEGCVFGVFTDSGCTEKAGELVTKVDGTTDTIKLRAGTYYIKELKVPKGFLLNTEVKKLSVAVGETKSVQFKDIPGTDPFGITLIKKDVENQQGTPLGGASLAGAQFTVQYYDGYYDELDISGKELKRQWIFETKYDESKKICSAVYDDAHKVSGDPLYKSNSGSPVLPLGTYVIWESKAPEGYLLNENAYLTDRENRIVATGGEKYVAQVTASGTQIKLTGGNEYSRYDRVKRGDFEFSKTGEEGERLAGIEFEIISDTTKERHTFVTDENGYYNSSVEYLKHNEKNGLWFGEYVEEKSGEKLTAPINNDWGALPFDTYTINELPGEANEGLKLLKNIRLTISREGFNIDMGTLTDWAVTLSTMAHDEKSKTQYAAAGKNVTLQDTVSYTGLQKNLVHTLKTTLMNRETKEPVLDEEGNAVTAIKEFKPKAKDGTVRTEVTFDASRLAGKDVVFFEELYLGTELTTENLLASHKDISAAEQTIHFPSIRTKAAGKDTQAQSIYAGEKVTIIDTVSYTNLPVGKEMKLDGIQMLKKNGKPAKDADGNEITGTATFTPEEPDGEAEVSFTFNASNLGGETLVTFETLSWSGLEIEHKDIDDKEQAVFVSDIDLVKTADKEEYEIGDTIHYTIKAAPKGGAVFRNAVIGDKGLTKGVELVYDSIRINKKEYPLESAKDVADKLGEDDDPERSEPDLSKEPEIHLVKTEDSFKVLVDPFAKEVTVTFDGIVKDESLRGKKINNTATVKTEQSPEQESKVKVKVPKKKEKEKKTQETPSNPMTPQEILKSVQTGLEDHGALFAGIAAILAIALAVLWRKRKHDGKAGAGGEKETAEGGTDKEARGEKQEKKLEEETAEGERLEKEKGKEEPEEDLERSKAEEEPEGERTEEK